MLRKENGTGLYRQILQIKEQQVIRVDGVSYIHTGFLSGLAGQQAFQPDPDQSHIPSGVKICEMYADTEQEK